MVFWTFSDTVWVWMDPKEAMPTIKPITTLIKILAILPSNISVYDINGRQIDNLVNHYHAPGIYMTRFAANNISSGIYFVTLKHKNGIQTQKIVYTK